MKKEWNVHKEEDFKVPSEYFENFEERLNDRLFLDQSQLAEGDGFKVPEHYFENFKIEEPEKDSGLIFLFSKHQIAIWTTAAAILLTVFLMRDFIFPTVDPLDSISSSSLNAYLEEENIQEYLTEEEVSKIESNTNLLNPVTISDDLIFEAINKDILEEEAEPTLATN